MWIGIDIHAEQFLKKMNCAEFRRNHCAFVDDILPGIELVRMQRHLNECAECSELDCRIRRSLLAIKNLPPIQPSADFGLRLEEKLRRCKPLSAHNETDSFRSVITFGSLAFALILGYAAATYRDGNAGRGELILPAVIATAEAPWEQEEVIDYDRESTVPAIIASVSMGMPIWPAALFAEQASAHFSSSVKENQ